VSERKAFFDEQGYYVARGVYSPEEVARLEAEFDRVIQQITAGGPSITGPNSGEDNGIISTVNVQQYSAYWLTHGLLHPPFLDIAEEFIGPDIILQHSSLYEKRKASVVGPFRMHQDWSYVPVRDDTMIAGMIYVSPATEAMGALRIYPGTHHSRMEDAVADDRGVAFHEKYPLEGSTVLEADPGDVVYFHYRTVHGSTSNQTDTPRKAVHVRMFSGTDCREDPYHFCENLVLRGWNHHTNSANAIKSVPRPAE
jgi:phytanoyl-CoA hydroxylase